ncbi:MAG: transglutaminase domain-containing protein, partial [Candidatus Heimdallarchaeota archaeon]|nr:transglutaminase domain-containing protein [Candidatus Heimdallarchaeota archaeon]
MFWIETEFTNEDIETMTDDLEFAFQKIRDEENKEEWTTKNVQLYDYFLNKAKKSRNPELYSYLLNGTRKNLDRITKFCIGLSIGCLALAIGSTVYATADPPIISEYNGTQVIALNKYTDFPVKDFYYADKNMKTFAKEITKNCNDDLCRARNIYDGIKNETKLNIHYCKAGTPHCNDPNANPYLGREGYKSAMEVFYKKDKNGNRYGTCIEQANLFITLARSIGMNSTGVSMTVKESVNNITTTKINNPQHTEFIIKLIIEYSKLSGHGAAVTYTGNNSRFFTDLTFVQKPVILDYKKDAEITYISEKGNKSQRYHEKIYTQYKITNFKTETIDESIYYQHETKKILNNNFYRPDLFTKG